MVYGLFCLYQCFEANKFLRRREKRNSLETITPVIKPYYSHISFDGKFFVYFEFLIEILIPPTHFEISFDYLVGIKSQKTLNSYFAPQRHHVVKLRKVKLLNRNFFIKIAIIFKFKIFIFKFYL